MGSSRLPGKIALSLGDKPALERCVSRVMRASRVDEAVVATTNLRADDATYALAERCGVRAHRGSEHDVLARYVETARAFGADVVVRVTSDCPLIDPDIIDAVIAAREASDADYASNVMERHLPRGLDVEALTMQSLEDAHARAVAPEDREHVTRFVVQGAYTKRSVRFEVPRAGLENERWTLDTNDDYAFLSAMFDLLGGRADHASFGEVLAMSDAHPHVRMLNAHVLQKTS